jgi:hypothetical protein
MRHSCEGFVIASARSNLKLLFQPLFLFFFALMQKRNKKNQGKRNRSARFAEPTRLKDEEVY